MLTKSPRLGHERKNYGHEYNVWYSIDDLQDAQELIAEYESRTQHATRRSRTTPAFASAVAVLAPRKRGRSRKIISRAPMPS